MSGEYAPRSVLKAVIVIQKIGKKMIKAINHPTVPKTREPYFFMSAAFEIFSEHLDQEVGNDVREDDGKNTAGGSGADVESLDTQ
jgi:hypothetical protein